MAKTRQMKSQNQIPPSNGTRDINKRHSARQKKRRRNARRRRMFLFMLLLIISTIIIMFMTPVFNIRSVKIIGNEKVTTEEITSKTESAINQNLFKINLKQLSSSISSFAYLKDIKISRIIYPPSLKVSVTESTPAITVYYNGEYAILDEFCKVLEMEQGKSNGDTTTPQYETDDGTSTLVVKSGSEVAGNLEKPANLPEILGLDINNCIIGHLTLGSTWGIRYIQK